MSRISPLPADELDHLSEQMELTKSLMGFLPNSVPTMARVPGLAEAFSGLAGVVIANPMIPMGLNQMAAQVASSAAGCRYCQAHTAHSAHGMGVAEEKIADLWNFENSEQFDDAERAVLNLALHAGSVPNTSTQEHFDELKSHFDDSQIAGFVATISLFGFLNRWNDTVATEIESAPQTFAEKVLGEAGWVPGRHGAPLEDS